MKFRGRSPRSRLERIACPMCGAVVAAFVPKDGDGSALRPVWHKTNGTPCDGRFEVVVP